jgi:hypothetical protein
MINDAQWLETMVKRKVYSVADSLLLLRMAVPSVEASMYAFPFLPNFCFANSLLYLITNLANSLPLLALIPSLTPPADVTPETRGTDQNAPLAPVNKHTPFIVPTFR